MGLDDMINQGKEALNSDQAEQVTDNVLDSVSDFAKKFVPEEHHGTVDDVRDSVDGHIGNE